MGLRYSTVKLEPTYTHYTLFSAVYGMCCSQPPEGDQDIVVLLHFESFSMQSNDQQVHLYSFLIIYPNTSSPWTSVF